MSLAGEIDPRFVDLALGLIGIEAVALVGYRAATGRGPSLFGTIANLLAGGFLLLVLREMLVGAAPIWITASLAAALVAHVLDLATRWRRRAPASRIALGALASRSTQRMEDPKTPELGSPRA